MASLDNPRDRLKDVVSLGCLSDVFCIICTVIFGVTVFFLSFFFNDTATTEIYTLSLHDALPIFEHLAEVLRAREREVAGIVKTGRTRSEEHTSELQSLRHLVCRLLLEKKKK